MIKRFILVLGLCAALIHLSYQEVYAAAYPVALGGTGSTTLGGILNAGSTPTSPLRSLSIGSGLLFDGTTLSVSGGGSSFSTSSANFWLGTKTTDDVAQGSNLYFTNEAARLAISGTGAIQYDTGTGVIALEDPLSLQYGGVGFETATKGDIVYSPANNTLGVIPLGTNSQVLIVGGSGEPIWSDDVTVNGILTVSGVSDGCGTWTSGVAGSTGSPCGSGSGSGFSTSSADYWASLGLGFSTTSADVWKANRDFFSTTSANAWSLKGLGFSTTSADIWKANRDFWSTTSANAWSLLGNGFSTTSTDFWAGLGRGFSTTSANAWSLKGLGFSTTSTAYFSSLGLAWSTTSADAWDSIKARWGTTSSNYWASLGNGFSTTSTDFWAGLGRGWSTTSADAYIIASTTIVKDATSSIPTGAVPFGSANGLSHNVKNFFWDNTNGRLGVGTSSPSQLVHISSPSADAALRFESGESNYTIGIDNSATSQFVIASSSVLGTTNLGGFDTKNGGFFIGTALAANVSAFGINKTITSADIDYARIGGSLTSSATTQQSALSTVGFTFSPTGASLSAVYTLLNIPTINNSATPIASANGIFSRVDLGATYTGLVSAGAGFHAGNPSINAAATPFAAYRAFQVDALTNGNGTTTGTVINEGLSVAAFSAAAGAGGTVVNRAAILSVPSGSSAGTSNYGLYVTGNGGALGTKYAIYNDSTANNYYAGNIGIGDTSPLSALTVGSGDPFQVNILGGITTTATTSLAQATSSTLALTSAPLLAQSCLSTNATGDILGCNIGNLFSTTSANAWSLKGLGWSTTSAAAWSLLGQGFSTTSTDYWSSLGRGFSTTSINAWDALYDNWTIANGALTPTSTIQSIGVYGSSTIGAGGIATGLTISGSATTTGAATTTGTFAVGTSTPSFKVTPGATSTVGIATTSPIGLNRLTIEGRNDFAILQLNYPVPSASVTASDAFIDFTTQQGSVGSVTGTAVAGTIIYNTFTGSHYTTVDDMSKVLPAYLLEATGEPIPRFLQLSKARLACTRASQSVYGVYGGDTKDGYQTVLSIGTGLMWVTNTGENIKTGDLLMSSNVCGMAEKQKRAGLFGWFEHDDGVISNITAGKAMENVEWKEGETSRLIKVIYEGG